MTNIVAAWVSVDNRIIPAIREHVVADDTLAGGDECVRVDESADLGVVVAAVQVIQSQLLVKPVARRPKTGTFRERF